MTPFPYSLDDALPADFRGGAVTLGNFDGVHLGHRALIAETVRHARLVGGPAVAVTFDPPPIQLLRPAAFQPLLTPVAFRCDLLHEAGADRVVVLQTTPELLRLSARDFFERILRDAFAARAIVEGFNFAFGKDRAGTNELLKTWGESAGMVVALLDAQARDGRPFSSSRVRERIVAGDVAGATELLGRPHRLFGVVGEGNRRGRTLGFPTANLTTLHNLAPGPGVYAARVPYRNAIWNAAAHIGPRPTFGDPNPSVEIHLLDFSGDLYGQELSAEFIRKIREPRSFASVEELTVQIETDVAAIRTILG